MAVGMTKNAVEGSESSAGATGALDLSVVIPLFNEAGNVPTLHDEISQTLSPLGVSYEILYVDDGSTDGTGEILKGIRKGDPRAVLIPFRRNFGQTAALQAGFDRARGDIIITMDGDLQNDPRDIPALLEKARHHDVVSGWRRTRKDPFWSRRLPSAIANWLISWITGVKLHDYGCTLKAYRREVIENIHLHGDLHRFVPALAAWVGIDLVEMEVRHHPRRLGKSKYSIWRTFRVLMDLLVVKFFLSFSASPIRIFGGIGALAFLGGFGISVYLTFLKLALGQQIGGRPLLLLGALLLLVGVQLIMMGLLGELVARIYYEKKPLYILRHHPSEKKTR